MKHNLIETRADDKLYRVFATRWLMDAWESRGLTLRPPKCWDDPFENMLLEQRFKLPGVAQPVLASEVFNKFYAQCWCHEEEETDATWRLYAPNKDGVRVCVEAGALLGAAFRAAGRFARVSCFLGRVEYCETEEIVSFLRKPENVGAVLCSSSGRKAAQWFLLKRKEFAHERETRLVVRDWNKQGSPVHCLRIQIDPNQLFESVVFDPRMADTDYDAASRKLASFGFKGHVGRSELYTLPALGVLCAKC
jgi:hypothetical protein